VLAHFNIKCLFAVEHVINFSFVGQGLRRNLSRTAYLTLLPASVPTPAPPHPVVYHHRGGWCIDLGSASTYIYIYIYIYICILFLTQENGVYPRCAGIPLTLGTTVGGKRTIPLKNMDLLSLHDVLFAGRLFFLGGGVCRL